MPAQPEATPEATGAVVAARELPRLTGEERAGCIAEISEQEDFLEALRWLAELSALQIRFTAFTDGRGFSWAQQLRQRYGYSGSLRATGPLLPDQQQMLEQCGFDLDPGDAQTAVPQFTVRTRANHRILPAAWRPAMGRAAHRCSAWRSLCVVGYCKI